MPEKKAEELEDEGWAIRWLDPRREGDERTGVFKVRVSYKNPNSKPKVVMITGDKKTELDEDAVEALDSAELETVDLVVRPYNWEVNGKVGVAAYLKSGYFTVLEDDLEKKYYGTPEDDNDVPF